MKKIILSAFIISMAISCEKKSTETLDTDFATDSLVVIPETSDPVESSTLQTCYMEATGKDSVFVSLEDNLGTIIGKMRYKNFEKDSSMGDVVGSQNGDTLKLVYTFEAEGKTSEREIYFLKKGENIIEGIGEQKLEGNKSNYANPAKLKYEGNTLKQVDCTDFDKKFKGK
ncbi:MULTISPECIES: hypothetical protein [unclassified Kaistella]|uniref:hypothetical protein n=1 Tax=unclassified Kaistella TaxID=2762626 RepID=UPI0027368AED|nr:MULTISPECIES: hypothetical protein [unclassified Kaistella]MCZ2083399.1 hypothetical protein [Flavobacteriales bacterium]MDP2453870.1 hypothetical protein [Kaistella sp. SH11-4b]MDP2456927.1 hypothetical protein [Kaistella sp. SH40-3]MDP2459684.1 hypothetical protein [Kaistella sp. SH19-2b]